MPQTSRQPIAPGLYAASSVPPSCCRKACRLLAAFQAGQHNYRRLKEGRGNGYFKINVGLFWRMLSRDGGQTWELMTHERYNTSRKI